MKKLSENNRRFNGLKKMRRICEEEKSARSYRRVDGKSVERPPVEY